VEINNLQFKYKTDDKFETNIKELTIVNGEFLAIVGKSGSGKSTLVDLILGVFTPQYGSIRISGKDPQSAIEEWPTALAYVPQNVHAIRGTLRENVTFGYPAGSFSDEELLSCLSAAELSEFVTSEKKGLDSMIGTNGKFLSGGERQRLGIARALLGKPKIIILDEATSSLDSQTEDKIGKTLSRIQKHVTLIVVAHRLSTVKAADRLLYIENGEIITSGTFEEVKEKVPDFESQTRLLGM
jgi:ABC-type multidrug transport system fused ATPase/permease subunit